MLTYSIPTPAAVKYQNCSRFFVIIKDHFSLFHVKNVTGTVQLSSKIKLECKKTISGFWTRNLVSIFPPKQAWKKDWKFNLLPINWILFDINY